jgi:hypothetical protein
MFRVEWIQAALDDVANLWMQADSVSRQAITSAANTLEQELQTDPYRQSESREDGERVLFAYPLGAQIEIDTPRRIVWILHVWRFRRRGE